MPVLCRVHGASWSLPAPVRTISSLRAYDYQAIFQHPREEGRLKTMVWKSGPLTPLQGKDHVSR